VRLPGSTKSTVLGVLSVVLIVNRSKAWCENGKPAARASGKA
jgi:hypothetical protein